VVFRNVTQCRMVHSYQNFDGSSFLGRLLHIFISSPPTIHNNFSLLLGNVQLTLLKLCNVVTRPNTLTKNGLGIPEGVSRFLHLVIARKEIGRGHRPVARQRLQLIKQDD
jgi:hypothetical protein